MCHMAAMHYQWIYICKWWWSFKINVCENTLNNKHIFFECSSNNGLLTVLSRAHSRESIRGKNLSYEFTLQRSIHQFETFESNAKIQLSTLLVRFVALKKAVWIICQHMLVGLLASKPALLSATATRSTFTFLRAAFWPYVELWPGATITFGSCTLLNFESSTPYGDWQPGILASCFF